MMYHYVRNPGDAAEAGSGIRGMGIADFEAQLDELRRRFQIISWADLQQHLAHGAVLPDRACLLTFDDGVSDHYINVFPALKARGCSGLFFALARPAGSGLALGHKIHFLVSALGLPRLRAAVLERLDAVQQATYRAAEARYRSRYDNGSEADEIDVFKLVLQRDLSNPAESALSGLVKEHLGDEIQIASKFYLSPGQIAEMARAGMHFGGHSRSHPWFDWIEVWQQAAEIRATASWLAAIEPAPWAFAYPYGGLTDQSSRLLGEAGFAAGFTTRPHSSHNDPFRIGRYDGESGLAEIDEPGSAEETP